MSVVGIRIDPRVFLHTPYPSLPIYLYSFYFLKFLSSLQLQTISPYSFSLFLTSYPPVCMYFMIALFLTCTLFIIILEYFILLPFPLYVDSFILVFHTSPFYILLTLPSIQVSLIFLRYLLLVPPLFNNPWISNLLVL